MTRIAEPTDVDSLDLDKGDGLVPVVVQHATNGEVLMLAYANREAILQTLRTEEMWFYSRSRSELWNKGATSGNRLRLVSLHADCDNDSLLAKVKPQGPACHRGTISCFEAPPTMSKLARTLRERRASSDPSRSYTARLLSDENLRHKKLGEEVAELLMACMSHDRVDIAQEAADLVYHVLVACLARGVMVEDVLDVLEGR